MRENLQNNFLVGNDYAREYNHFITECKDVISQNLDNYQFSVDVLAYMLNMSHSSLYKKVKSSLGISVNELIRLIRLKKAAELLKSQSCNVKDAAYCSGFNDLKHFREQFKKTYKVLPSVYKLNKEEVRQPSSSV